MSSQLSLFNCINKSSTSAVNKGSDNTKRRRYESTDATDTDDYHNQERNENG